MNFSNRGYAVLSLRLYFLSILLRLSFLLPLFSLNAEKHLKFGTKKTRTHLSFFVLRYMN